MPVIYGSAFNQKIKNQLIRKRQSFSRKKFDIQDYQKMSWVRLVSGAQVKLQQNRQKQIVQTCGTTGKKLRGLNFPLGNQIQLNSQDIYFKDPMYRPVPYISGVQVQTSGNVGQLRKATVSWNCPSKQWLQIYQNFYLVPGITCILQWGHNNIDAKIVKGNIQEYLQGKFTIKIDKPRYKKMLMDFGLTEQQADKRICRYGQYMDNSEWQYQSPSEYFRDKSYQSNGNYDGMVGFITNISYQMQDDGSYQCMTQIISAGLIGFQFDVRDQDYYQQNARLTKKDSKSLLQIIKSKEQSVAKKFNLMGWLTSQDTKMKNTWIQLGAFMTMLNSQLNISFIKDKKSTVVKYNDLYDQYVPMPPRTGFKWGNKKDNQKEILFYSVNPQICLIPDNVYINGAAVSHNDSPLSSTPNKGIMRIDKNSGILGNLLISAKLVQDAINNCQPGNVITMLQYMITEINNATCNWWDLQVKSFDNGQSICIIDQNFVRSDNRMDVYEFKTFGSESQVYGANYSTKIPDALKATIFIGVNSLQKTQYSFLSSHNGRIVITDRFRNFITSSNEKEKQMSVKYEQQAKKLTDIKYKLTIPWNNQDFVISSDIVQLYKKYLQSLKLREVNKDKFLQFMYPLELSIDIQGISGIYFGQLLKVDFIPQKYRNPEINNIDAYFQVNIITDNVSNNYWTKNFTTLMRICYTGEKLE